MVKNKLNGDIQDEFQPSKPENEKTQIITKENNQDKISDFFNRGTKKVEKAVIEKESKQNYLNRRNQDDETKILGSKRFKEILTNNVPENNLKSA